MFPISAIDERIRMNYQNLLCVGDSQTFGARSYGCYPLYLAKLLTERSAYAWRAISVSGKAYTARDLWFKLNVDLETIQDTRQACVLIGTNDVGENKDPDIFEEYYRQILRTFFIKKFKVVWCGEIPPIHADGHVYFDRGTQERRTICNARIERVASEFGEAKIVRFEGLDRNCYEDPVHFNEAGNRQVAEAFAQAIQAR
jgi:lysophospholipase L1-like esterase